MGLPFELRIMIYDYCVEGLYPTICRAYNDQELTNLRSGRQIRRYSSVLGFKQC
jgi:hypothetical protein